MRADDHARQTNSNGYSSAAAAYSVKKNNMPHNYPSATNGSQHALTNGKAKRRSSPRSIAYRGHNREELTRILIQGLKDMGYEAAAHTLSDESGFELENADVAAFRLAVLEGRWSQAERLLLGPNMGVSQTTYGNGNGDSHHGSGLVLAEGANKYQMLFAIRQQKFIELLIQRKSLEALRVLRDDLQPLNYDTHALHTLSGLLFSTNKDLEARLDWPMDTLEARQALLEDLTKSIAPSVMIRDHRLAELLDQVKQAQINECLYHNTAIAPSLYADHKCNQEDFPSRTWMIIEEHTDEVYCVAFSPDGKYLATAGADKLLIIFDTVSFRPVHKFTQHTEKITHVAWSPDSRKLITAEWGPRARIWDIAAGKLLMVVEHNTNEASKVTTGAWLPDSTSFVTGCHDLASKMCLWSLAAPDSRKPLHTWKDEFRVSELTITPNGKYLICNDHSKPKMVVYDLATKQEVFRMHFLSKITCLTASRDSRFVLINIAEGEVCVFDLEAKEIIRRLKSQDHENNIIRNCFGGAAENFILSGSKDGGVLIWHKENGRLIDILKGHGKGSKKEDPTESISCVTCVSWNPKDPGMFASGGDDRKVRIWTNALGDDASMIYDPRIRHPDLQRTSAIRSTSNL